MNHQAKIIKSILLAKIKKQPYKLNFAITSACNSRCKTCNVWQEFSNNPRKIKNDLTLLEIEKIFRNLPKSIAWLALSGGEPFLRKDLTEICQAAVKNIPNLGLISIPSNGLATDQIVKEIKKILSLPLKNLFLNFSIDGPEKIHDKIRGLEGAFKTTWITYLKILGLSKTNPKLHVNIETTVSKYNLNYLAKFFPKLTNDGHKITVTIAHTGYLYKNYIKADDFTKLNHDSEKLKGIIKIVKKNLSFASPLDLIQRFYLDNILKYYQNPKKQPLPCIALKSSLAMDARGNITPCFMWGKILGNIRDFDYNLRDFLKNNHFGIEKVWNEIRSENCPNCWTPCEAYQSIINSFLII